MQYMVLSTTVSPLKTTSDFGKTGHSVCNFLFSKTASSFGRPFVKRFALWYQIVVCLSYLSFSVLIYHVLSCLSVCLSVTLVYCGQKSWMDQDDTWHAGPCHIVLDGDSAPKEAQPPPTIFGPYLLWPNGWMD